MNGQNIESNTNGYIIIKVSTANGAIPIENATIILRGNDGDNTNILLSLLTGRDGRTQRIALPAPPNSLSQMPSPQARPYSTYNIEVFKDGYYPQYYQSVPIFDKITAVQGANLIPLSEYDGQNPYFTEEQIFNNYPDPNL